MDQAELVRVGQGAHHREHQLGHVAGREAGAGPTGRLRAGLAAPGAAALALLDPLSQCLAGQVLEDHVRMALVLVDLVDGDDVGVIAPRRGPGLVEEAPRVLAVLAAHELERDQAAQAGIAGQEHLSHAAAPERSDQLVLAQGRAKESDRVEHLLEGDDHGGLLRGRTAAEDEPGHAVEGGQVVAGRREITCGNGFLEIRTGWFVGHRIQSIIRRWFGDRDCRNQKSPCTPREHAG